MPSSDLPRTEPGAPESIVACELGQVPYGPTWELQKEIQSALIAAKRADPPVPVPHVLLMVEHPHVYTLGKSGDADHLLVSDNRLEALDASFYHIDRGGDITYHGPGQVVGYPLLDLDRFFTDLGRYLRTLEEIVLRTCADYGIESGTRVDGRTGTWIGPDDRGPERKICAMGVRCSRWVTMHGYAFNVNTDLRYFDHIVPCGIRDRGVTSLQKELDRPVDVTDVHDRLLAHTADLFDADVTRLSGDDARAFLARYADDVPTAEPVLDDES